MTEEISAAIEKHKLICFLKTYETTFQSQLQRKNTIIKAYTTDELPAPSLSLSHVPKSVGPSEIRTLSTSKPADAPDQQMLTPTAKLLLEQIAESASHKGQCSSELMGPKRALTFSEPDVQHAITTEAIPEEEKTLKETATITDP